MVANDLSSVERFPPTNGRITGTLGVLLGLVLVGTGVAGRGGLNLSAVLAGLLVVALCWTSVLYPGLRVEHGAVVMRNMFRTIRLPLAAIEEARLIHVMLFRVGDHKYLSPVISQSRRQLHRRQTTRLRGEDFVDRPHTDVLRAKDVETRINDLMDEAREHAGIRVGSDAQRELASEVEQTTNWWHVALVTLLALALLLSLLF